MNLTLADPAQRRVRLSYRLDQPGRPCRPNLTTSHATQSWVWLSCRLDQPGGDHGQGIEVASLVREPQASWARVATSIRRLPKVRCQGTSRHRPLLTRPTVSGDRPHLRLTHRPQPATATDAWTFRRVAGIGRQACGTRGVKGAATQGESTRGPVLVGRLRFTWG